MGIKIATLDTEEKLKKLEIDTYVSLWLIMISAMIVITLELTSIFVGYYNITGFTFVAVVYIFIIFFIFMLYNPLKKLKLKLKGVFRKSKN